MCMQEKVCVCAVVVVKTKCMFKKRRLNKKIAKERDTEGDEREREIENSGTKVVKLF